ncbi:MAG: hypothetical protein MRERV_19c003 [Mycoplasmataceae bacterium RV_VA103A]|nr:MAG: hypothetical protein MRERV_19c003 [Mycoplasmataceae bacterium RV_VA103A]
MYQCKISEESKKMFMVSKRNKVILLVHLLLLFCL